MCLSCLKVEVMVLTFKKKHLDKVNFAVSVC